MQVELYNKDGQISGEVELDDGIFAVEPNENAMHQAVVSYLARKRQGTAKTKVKSEVRGGGKKPWRQKGRGTARAGSIRSPLWVGGGTIHGPKPHRYDVSLSKKVKRLARKSALSVRISEKNLIVLEDFKLEEYKTKEMAQIIENLKLDGQTVLMLIPDADDKLYISSRNIKKLNVTPADKINTYDILSHKKIVLFKSAVEKIVNTFSN